LPIENTESTLDTKTGKPENLILARLRKGKKLIAECQTPSQVGNKILSFSDFIKEKPIKAKKADGTVKSPRKVLPAQSPKMKKGAKLVEPSAKQTQFKMKAFKMAGLSKQTNGGFKRKDSVKISTGAKQDEKYIIKSDKECKRNILNIAKSIKSKIQNFANKQEDRDEDQYESAENYYKLDDVSNHFSATYQEPLKSNDVIKYSKVESKRKHLEDSPSIVYNPHHLIYQKYTKP